MAGNNNSFASLTPTLLARKGGAKPAMRPQLQPMHEFHEAVTRDMDDDLGWNDMGIDPSAGLSPLDGGAQVVPIAVDGKAPKGSAKFPKVVQQQAELSGKVNSKGKASGKAKTTAELQRIAFTLRLDADRHLKLRVACAILGRSAQDIVTEALDSQLSALADLDMLAGEIRKRR